MYLLNDLCFLVVIIHQLLCLVRGHGRLIDPAARNYAWRLPEFKDRYQPYYNDNQLYCGGRDRQWRIRGGKCGVCGDEHGIQSPLFVFPGRYAKNIITKTYRQGQQIQVKVDITANHKGWFEFRLGNIGTPPITQAKLTHLLQLVSGGTRWKLPDTATRVYTIDLKLPSDLTCAQCVLQWWYNTGNHWGCEDQNNCGLGLGPQESFVNCADIVIVSSTNPMTGIPTQGATPSPITNGPEQTTPTEATTASPQTTLESTPSTSSPTEETTQGSTTVSSTTSGPDQTTSTEASTEETTPSSNPPTEPLTEEPMVGPCDGVYVAGRLYTGNKYVHDWCYKYCHKGYCPASICQCKPYYSLLR